jgi:thiamine biosynthesis lipoprotein
VVAKDCAFADVMATALFVMEAERAYAFAAERGMAAFFIERDGSGRLVARQTPKFAKLGAERVRA